MPVRATEAGHQMLLFTCHRHIMRIFEQAQVEVRTLPSRGAKFDPALWDDEEAETPVAIEAEVIEEPEEAGEEEVVEEEEAGEEEVVEEPEEEVMEEEAEEEYQDEDDDEDEHYDHSIWGEDEELTLAEEEEILQETGVAPLGDVDGLWWEEEDEAQSAA